MVIIDCGVRTFVFCFQDIYLTKTAVQCISMSFIFIATSILKFVVSRLWNFVTGGKQLHKHT